MGAAEEIVWHKANRSAEIGACVQVAPLNAELDGDTILRLEPAGLLAQDAPPRPPRVPDTPATITGDVAPDTHQAPPTDTTTPSGPVLRGAPEGVRWTQARLARSWGLGFATAGPGSLYDAVLSAGGGSVTADTGTGPQVVRDATELRRVLAEQMSHRPPAEGIRRWSQVVTEYVSAVRERVTGQADGAELSPEQLRQVEAQIDGGQAWQQVVASLARPGLWEELASRVAPHLIGDHLGMGLLVVGADGRVDSYGPASGSPVVIMATGTGPAPEWIGTRSVSAGRVLGGLSAGQVAWAADAGMRFVGPDPDAAQGHFIDALMNAARAANVPVLFPGDATQVRRELARRMRGDRELAGSTDWTAISEEYVHAKAPVVGGEQDARRRLDNGEALQEIIAHVQNAERGNALVGRMWPLLVSRYLGTGLRILAPDGDVRVHGGGDITLAVVPGANPGEDVWMGLAPVAAPTVHGAGTRAADVPGGWSTPEPDRTTTVDVSPEPSVPAPAGATAAQKQWVRRHRMRFGTIPAGQDRFLDAVLLATGGGFTTKDGVFVGDATDLREKLVQRIGDARDTDLDLWLVIYTAYATHYQQRDPGSDDAQGMAQRISERIDSGQALNEITRSITDPDYWPELGDELTPFLLNRLDLGVRVIGPDGRPGKYGRGKPAYVAPLAPAAGGGRQRWVALTTPPTRYPATSRLATPSLADPVLMLLARALDTRKAAAGGAADAAIGRLRQARDQWLRLTSPTQETGAPAAVPNWDADRLRDLVDQVSAAPAGDDARGLSSAVEVLAALFPGAQGGIRPAPADAATGEKPAAVLPGLPATEWIMAPSVPELIDALPEGAVALFFDGRRVRLLVDTMDGHRIVTFGPDQPAEARVMAPAPPLLDSLAAVDGIALVVGGGRAVPAAELDSPFTLAAESPRVEELLTGPQWLGAEASATGDPATDADVPPAVSRPQRVWAQSHQARFSEVAPGPNAFFDAVIAAAGGRLTGNGLDAADAVAIRAALAQRVRDMAASDSVRDWPKILNAYVFDGEERILKDFFGSDPAEVVRQVLHAQLNDHINTGEAWTFIETAITRPGHWDEITERLAPDLLADLLDLSLVIVDPQGRTRLHGGTGGRRLVVARTQTDTGTRPGWAAVVPTAPAQDHATQPLADLAIDTTTFLAKNTSVGAAATLNADQQQAATDGQLRVEPTQTGATSFSSAVLTAAGGGFLLDSDTYIGSPEQLRQTLATLFRDRPDVLPPASRERVEQVTGPMDTEDITDAVRNPANPLGDQIAQHLVAPYLGIQLRVIGSDGTTAEQGTGQTVTVAPTTDQDGQSHWAALVPTAQTTMADLHLPTLPGLPDLFHFGQPSSGTPWNTGDYKNLEPEAGKIDDPWRDSTFSRDEFGESVYCVSVTVITRHSLVA